MGTEKDRTPSSTSSDINQNSLEKPSKTAPDADRAVFNYHYQISDIKRSGYVILTRFDVYQLARELTPLNLLVYCYSKARYRGGYEKFGREFKYFAPYTWITSAREISRAFMQKDHKKVMRVLRCLERGGYIKMLTIKIRGCPTRTLAITIEHNGLLFDISHDGKDEGAPDENNQTAPLGSQHDLFESTDEIISNAKQNAPLVPQLNEQKCPTQKTIDVIESKEKFSRVKSSDTPAKLAKVPHSSYIKANVAYLIENSLCIKASLLKLTQDERKRQETNFQRLLDQGKSAELIDRAVSEVLSDKNLPEYYRSRPLFYLLLYFDLVEKKLAGKERQKQYLDDRRKSLSAVDAQAEDDQARIEADVSKFYALYPDPAEQDKILRPIFDAHRKALFGITYGTELARQMLIGVWADEAAVSGALRSPSRPIP